MYTLKPIQPYKQQPQKQNRQNQIYNPVRKPQTCSSSCKGQTPIARHQTQTLHAQPNKKKHKTSFPAGKRGENDKKLVS
jgi:hypothetical protein